MHSGNVCVDSSSLRYHVRSQHNTPPPLHVGSQLLHQPRCGPNRKRLSAGTAGHLAVGDNHLVEVILDGVVLDLLGLFLHPGAPPPAGQQRRLPPLRHAHTVVRRNVPGPHDEVRLRHVGERVL